MYKKIVIGIDQSYTRSGISVCADGKLLKVSSTHFKGCTSKSDKRKHIGNIISHLIEQSLLRASEVIVVCERIRTFSNRPQVQESNEEKQSPGQFISIDYIKSTGALLAKIVDVAYEYNVPVFSADTRAWKSAIIGSSKAIRGNKKMAAILHIKKLGFDVSSVNRKGNIIYNDDAADSACIALYGFCENRKLKEEN